MQRGKRSWFRGLIIHVSSHNTLQLPLGFKSTQIALLCTMLSSSLCKTCKSADLICDAQFGQSNCVHTFLRRHLSRILSPSVPDH